MASVLTQLERETLGRPIHGYAERAAAQNRRQAIEFLTRVPRAWSADELIAEADKLIAYLEGRA